MEERHIYRQDYIEDSLVVRMGGRIAEELVFGVISTGANNDLVGSTELARKMVREWGMSDRVGPMAWGSQGAVFLGDDLMHSRDYSDETARVIDEEVERILREQEDRCRETLTEHRHGLDLVARALLEHETIDGAEVYRLVALGREGRTAIEEFGEWRASDGRGEGSGSFSADAPVHASADVAARAPDAAAPSASTRGWQLGRASCPARGPRRPRPTGRWRSRARRSSPRPRRRRRPRAWPAPRRSRSARGAPGRGWLDLLHGDGVARERLGPVPTPAHELHVADVNTATSHGRVGPVEVGPVELAGHRVARCGSARAVAGAAAGPPPPRARRAPAPPRGRSAPRHRAWRSAAGRDQPAAGCQGDRTNRAESPAMTDSPALDLDTDDEAGAPAVVTGGLTPDIASPTPDEPAGEPVARASSDRSSSGSSPSRCGCSASCCSSTRSTRTSSAGMITPLKEEFGVGDFAIGMLLSLALLFNGLITVPAGYLADRWNRTRAIGHTVVGWSAITAAGAASIGFPMLVGMRSALGFGQAITEPSAASLIGDYYPPDQRGKAFSIQQVMLLARRRRRRRPRRRSSARPGAGARRWSSSPSPACSSPCSCSGMREPKRGTADLMAAIGARRDRARRRRHADLFEHGFRQFLARHVDGLRADLRTILSIRTMRYALVGVAALLFTITALAAWLPQYYERHLHMAEGTGEALFMVLIIFGGIPGVLLGGRVADRYATRSQGGRLALPAIFIFVGNVFFTGSYLFRTDEYSSSTRDRRSAFVLQLVGLFMMTMAIPGLRAGLTDAVPAHLRGAGFGAFNLVAVVCGQAAAPVRRRRRSRTPSTRTSASRSSPSRPLCFLGAAILFRARKFLDEDMNKIMMAVLTAMQEEQRPPRRRGAGRGGRSPQLSSQRAPAQRRSLDGSVAGTAARDRSSRASAGGQHSGVWRPEKPCVPG